MVERVAMNEAYRIRVATLLKMARTRAGLNLAEMAAYISVAAAFTVPIGAEEWGAWEAGLQAVAVPAAALLAAFYAAGVENAGELDGSLPDPAIAIETEGALGTVLLLLNDPNALIRRANRLREAQQGAQEGAAVTG
jgi:transcriptional regulator with XRE-family HTH domain